MGTVKERPILFSTSMVQAILEGRKTQTRRVIKGTALEWLNDTGFSPNFVADKDNNLCPYGQIGDRLWVREKWAIHHEEWFTVYYATDDHTKIAETSELKADGTVRWRPSIHMPRKACRLILEITNIRVERLQDISEADAEAEGIELIEHNCFKNYNNKDPYQFLEDPIGSFQSLLQLINGPESWALNPWVWVIEFKRLAT